MPRKVLGAVRGSHRELRDIPGVFEVRHDDTSVFVRAHSPRAALDKWAARYRREVSNYRLVRDPAGPIAQADLPRPKAQSFWESKTYPMDLFVFVFSVKGIP